MLILFSEMIAVYFENHMKFINAPSGVFRILKRLSAREVPTTRVHYKDEAALQFHTPLRRSKPRSCLHDYEPFELVTSSMKSTKRSCLPEKGAKWKRGQEQTLNNSCVLRRQRREKAFLVLRLIVREGDVTRRLHYALIGLSTS